MTEEPILFHGQLMEQCKEIERQMLTTEEETDVTKY